MTFTASSRLAQCGFPSRDRSNRNDERRTSGRAPTASMLESFKGLLNKRPQLFVESQRQAAACGQPGDPSGCGEGPKHLGAAAGRRAPPTTPRRPAPARRCSHNAWRQCAAWTARSSPSTAATRRSCASGSCQCSLEAMLTSAIYTDRVLGVSHMLSLPVSIEIATEVIRRTDKNAGDLINWERLF